ncbi:MAG: hypothetical protein M0042_00145 [Nitrospiraceae bacterium]|nr:hypothetical protein [Nitrospiraceae bacterium]
MHTETKGCPSCASLAETDAPAPAGPNRLSHWPIQLKLMGTIIPFLNNADVLVAADCTAFATPWFHTEFLKDRKVLIGCPKLDDGMQYIEKFKQIFSTTPIKSLTCLRMEVPCCGGMTVILREALKQAGKNIPLTEMIISTKGDLIAERPVNLA